ncbi:MAG: alpha/beta hydrolase [Leucobacter sp.]|nr:alpha/beta hydrolase [Leucobacter sp.]
MKTTYLTWQEALQDAVHPSIDQFNAVQAARRLHSEVAAENQGRPVPVASVSEHICRRPDETDIPVRIYRDHPGLVAPVVIFAHGGGWVLGSRDTHDNLCRSLCSESGWTVVSVDYCLAPEHIYPAQIDDVDLVRTWLIANAGELEVDGDRIALAGDSAGGNLAAGVCLRHRGDPRNVFQLLFYPALDGRLLPDGWVDVQPEDVLQYDMTRWFYHTYAGDPSRLSDAEVSPALADDLHDMPPALVIVGARDGLLRDAQLYVARLAESGVDAQLMVVDGMEHGFVQVAALNERRKVIRTAAAALRSRM